MVRKTREQISFNMSRVRAKDTVIERILCDELDRCGFRFYTRNDSSIFGKPDIVFRFGKVAIFCDSEFWHGFDWDNAKKSFKSNREFWIEKIEKNMMRDKLVNDRLRAEGWTVLRFWGRYIKTSVAECVDEIKNSLYKKIPHPYRTIDLCAGIGGIRRGFEMTGAFTNVLSAEIDAWACKTYEHLYGTNPYNDVTSEDFKCIVEQTSYDILLAGFPCQTFSRAGLGEGFANDEKGQIFFHIANIIERTRPCAFLLENVDHLVTREKGETFRHIIEVLEIQLRYKIIGVDQMEDGRLSYDPKSFIRNSREFGVPQNRPRTYIIGFDRGRFDSALLCRLPSVLPEKRGEILFHNLNDVLERDAEARYYLSSGYLETLFRHRERQESRGYGFGYRIVNAPDIQNPVANTLLATGGSGKERNLIYDPREGIAGLEIKGKKTPLNCLGIRVMTPKEWGKLQGFVNYAFLKDNGEDTFSFPDQMPDNQKYKQLGNSVTIPVIEEMARFMQQCLEELLSNEGEERRCNE